MKLRNFKSIQKDEIDFKPLTILTGPNSSGKSNILEAITILSQIAKEASTVSLTFPQHLEKKGAEYYQYPEPSIEYVVYKGETEREITIELHVLSKISKRIIGYSIKYTSDPLRTEQIIYVNKNPTFHTSYFKSGKSVFNRFERPLIWKTEEPKSPALHLLRPECFKPTKEELHKKRPKVDKRLRELAPRLTNELSKELGRVYWISAPRGMVPIEIQAGPDPKWVGKNGENLIYILSKIFGQRKYRLIQQRISDWSKRFEIGDIGAGFRKGIFLGADFEDPHLKTIVDMISASYGSRQLLTIITQIFWSNSGDTLLIEEPEISLHPESQVLIQELFAEAVSDKRQIICTTHSPFFILSLSKVIKQKLLSRNDVAVYHVEKKAEGTKTRLLELNDRGFVKGWIPSYMDIENKLFEEWVEGLD